MKLETFFEKFDQFAEAPDAVARMRELLIFFAVNGKLVPNDPRETPVTLTLSGLAPNNIGMPLNWRSGLVSDAFTFEYGNNLPAPKRSETGEYPVYGSNGIVGTHNTYLTKEPAIIVGRKGSAGALNIADGPSWTTDVAYFICPPKDLDLRFTYYLFVTLRLDELGKGIKPGLSRKEAYVLPIVLPPLAEQKRIVAKVDELMALCDQLEAQQQDRDTRRASLARASLARFADAPTPANLNFLFHKSYDISPADLRKSILTLAVQGKLAPQDLNDEPGEQILRRISSGTSIRKKANISILDKGAGKLPFGLPSGWSASRVESILTPTRGISYGVIKLGPEPSQGGVFILRCSNVRYRRIDLNGIRKVTEQLSSEYARTVLEGGEVLINVRGTLGGCAVVPPELKEYNIAREVAVIPVHTEFDARFLMNVIASPYFQDRVEDSLRGIAYKGLNLGLLRDFIVPIPPLAEQSRIVAKVDQLMALVDELETHLAASRTTAKNLLEALVAELTAAGAPSRSGEA
ncbi:MAG: restriction endonuclease subunit S [Desulfobulbus sp.]|nr:restriction endonuclease subunit S [Desulfobulbus sp.]